MAPLVGVLGSNSLDKLYGIQIHDNNVLLMLRHRAVLFGIVGSILSISVLHKPTRRIGYFVGLSSMSSYLALTLLEADSLTDKIQRVFWIDLVGTIWLGTAAIVSHLMSSKDKNI
jgi:hypothetical protein